MFGKIEEWKGYASKINGICKNKSTENNLIINFLQKRRNSLFLDYLLLHIHQFLLEVSKKLSSRPHLKILIRYPFFPFIFFLMALQSTSMKVSHIKHHKKTLFCDPKSLLCKFLGRKFVFCTWVSEISLAWFEKLIIIVDRIKKLSKRFYYLVIRNF